MPRLLTLLLSLALVALAAAPAAAQSPVDPGGQLVYTFVLDGLDGDRVDAGKAPFISSLLAGQADARTTYFRESRSIMVAETNPNHTAMATGAYADTSGIPGNAFAVYAPSDGSTCPAGPIDESRPPTTTDGTDPGCLKAETLFEAVQRQPGAERNVTAGIFGKPKLATLFAGKKVSPGRFDADYLWTPCVPGSAPTAADPYCKKVPARLPDGYTLVDATVMDEVLRTVRDGVAGDGVTFTGGGRRPNLTFVNFPAIDSSGHASGAGAEYDDAIAQADVQIKRFVDQQKELGLWSRTTLVLLSDHSMDTTAEKSSLGQRFTAAGIASGDYKIVQNGSAALVYLTDRTDTPARSMLLRDMREAATGSINPIADLANTPAVEALYREPNEADGGAANTVAAKHPAWRLTGPRTGDLVVTRRSGSAFNDPVNPLAGNHGGPQTRDNFFAVIGGSALVNQRGIEGAQDQLFDDTERNPTQAENVDVAPTVLRLLGLDAPAQNQGRFLTEAFRPDLLTAPTATAPTGTAPAATAPTATAPPGTTPTGTAPTGTAPTGTAPTGTTPTGTAPTGTAPTAAATAKTPSSGATPAACSTRPGFASAAAVGAGGGLRFRFARLTRSPVTVGLFQSSIGSRVLGDRRVVRFTGRQRGFDWAGRRGLRDGVYFARLSVRGPGGDLDTRRVALERRNGRFVSRPAFYRRASCGLVRSFKLERPVFGGRRNRAVDATYELAKPARVTVELLRGTRVVRRLAAASDRSAGRTFRLRVAAEGLRRGDYRVRLRLRRDGRTTTTALTTRRL